MVDEQAEYDSLWKEALEHYFDEFITFFFPEVYGGIDWTKSHEFLDKELQQVVRDAELGRRLVDKLVKVWRKNGEEAWVLVHVEVQGQVDPEFGKRMYIYNYRLFDRYNRQVVSLAVLADQNPQWRPKGFHSELWGCRVSLEFPVIKLLDYEKQWSVLEDDGNPFAVIVMAQLKAQATRQDPGGRLQWKLTLIKGLYKRGYDREDILELLRFIDWLMILPKDLEQEFTETLRQYEEDAKMPYITSFERIGLQKGLQEGRQEGLKEGQKEGLQEGIMEVLETRFKIVPQPITQIINSVNDLVILKGLLKEAVKTASLEEFRQALEKARP